MAIGRSTSNRATVVPTPFGFVEIRQALSAGRQKYIHDVLDLGDL